MASDNSPISLVYCAKHPVNFAMFEPVYRAIRNDPDFDIKLSSGRYRRRLGGLYWADPPERRFMNEHAFKPFNVDPAQLTKTSWHDTRNYDLYVTSNTSFRMRPKNARVSIQIFHGVSFRNWAINESVLRFDKLFFPGPYHMRQYLNRGLLKEGDSRIELIGMPKIDCLVDGSIDRLNVLKDLGLSPDRPTILWCPTGAHHNSFEKYGKSVFDAVEAAGCNLVLKLHDHPHLSGGRTAADVRKEAESYLRPNQALGTYPNVAPYLVAADLLISDASSVAYEYTVRDRPIVWLDVPELLNYRADMEGSAMDLETHGRKCGTVVEDISTLAKVLESELGNPGRMTEARQRTANDIFFQPGTATQRYIQRFKELGK